MEYISGKDKQKLIKSRIKLFLGRTWAQIEIYMPINIRVKRCHSMVSKISHDGPDIEHKNELFRGTQECYIKI